MARGSNTASQSKNASKNKSSASKQGAKKQDAKQQSPKQSKTPAKDSDERRVPLKKAQKEAAERSRQTAVQEQLPLDEGRLLDARTRKDIAGVVLAVLAVALLVTMAMKPSGIVTLFLHDSISLGLGVGAFLLPAGLLAICASLFVRTEREHFALRMGIGLGMLMLAILALLALYTPGGEADEVLFAADQLTMHGGYVGAGIAWVLLHLLGRAVGTVVLVGVALGGAIIIGFSVSGVIDLVREKGAEQIQRRRERNRDDGEVFETPQYALAPAADADAGRNMPAVRVYSADAVDGKAETRVIKRGGSGGGILGKAQAAAAAIRDSLSGGGRDGYDDRYGDGYDDRYDDNYEADYEGYDGYDEYDDGHGRRDSQGFRGRRNSDRFDNRRSDGFGHDREPEHPSRPTGVPRMPNTGYVPRDLSKPRRATSTIREQIDGGYGVGARGAEAVDMYWPGEYAFDEAAEYANGGFVPTAYDEYDDGFDEYGDDYGEYGYDGHPDAGLTTLAGEAVGAIGEFEPPTRRLPRASDKVEASGRTSRKASAPKADRSSAPTTALRPAQDAGQGAAEEDAQPSAVQQAMTRKLDRMAQEGAAQQVSKTASKPKAAPKKQPAKKSAERGGFVLPSEDLVKHSSRATKADEAELRTVAGELQSTIEDFGIMAKVVGWVAGPTVTLFKVDLPSGVRVNRIMNLTDDIALAMASPGVRIFAPIPGTNYVGIEVPNRTRQTVLLGDVLKQVKGGPLMVAIGKDVEGHAITADLAKMPHLLVAGTTGSGKSVAINSMIMTILMRATPDEVRLIMVDPKRVEFTPYNGIPHLYVPVVNDNKEAASALAWGVAEMEKRLKELSRVGVRNITQYNAKIDSGALDNPDAPEGEQRPKKMPYIVIVIDELADLMMNVGKEVELSISRIAQLARAAGIHLILATQRPSTNVVTGLIKANITNRMALTVASGIDSRVILDETGAENLIGYGDMLYGRPEYPKPVRIQSCFVDEDEIEAVVDHLKSQGEPEYHNEILKVNLIGLGDSEPDGSGGSSSSLDPLFWEAAEIVVSSGMGSTSNIQRRLSVGYSRAGRIMDMLEEKGIVGPPNGSKPREVLVDALELETLRGFEEHDESNDTYGF